MTPASFRFKLKLGQSPFIPKFGEPVLSGPVLSGVEGQPDLADHVPGMNIF